jgi:GT2 family glycosyltransferase
MSDLRSYKALGTVAYCATAPFVMERFAFSYGQMMAYNTAHIEKPGEIIYYDKQAMSWLPRGRNDIAKSMRGDWVFMLDADLEFDPDILERMLYLFEKHKAPVVTGIYTYKRKPHFPVLYQYNSKRQVYEIVAKWDGDADLFRVDAAGSGCLLIHKDVFTIIWHKLKEDPFDPIRQLSEDFSLFDRLRRVGVGVYVAPKVTLTHLGVTGYDYDPSQYTDSMINKMKERESK